MNHRTRTGRSGREGAGRSREHFGPVRLISQCEEPGVDLLCLPLEFGDEAARPRGPAAFGQGCGQPTTGLVVDPAGRAGAPHDEVGQGPDEPGGPGRMNAPRLPVEPDQDFGLFAGRNTVDKKIPLKDLDITLADSSSGKHTNRKVLKKTGSSVDASPAGCAGLCSCCKTTIAWSGFSTS